MKIKIMVGSLLDKPNNGICNIQHSQQTINGLQKHTLDQIAARNIRISVDKRIAFSK